MEEVEWVKDECGSKKNQARKNLRVTNFNVGKNIERKGGRTKWENIFNGRGEGRMKRGERGRKGRVGDF